MVDQAGYLGTFFRKKVILQPFTWDELISVMVDKN